MRVGDILEPVAALLIAIAVFLIFGCTVGSLGGSLLVVGIFLGYEAQVLADHPLRTEVLNDAE